MLPAIALPYVVFTEGEKTSFVVLTPKPVELWKGKIPSPISSLSINHDTREIYALSENMVFALLLPSRIQEVFRFSPEFTNTSVSSAVLMATTPPAVLYTPPSGGIRVFAKDDNRVTDRYTISPLNNRLIVVSHGVAHVVVRYKEEEEEDFSAVVNKDAVNIRPYLAPHFLTSIPPQVSVYVDACPRSEAISFCISGEELGRFVLIQPEYHPSTRFLPICLITDKVTIGCFCFSLIDSYWALISIHSNNKPVWEGFTRGVVRDLYARNNLAYVCTQEPEKPEVYKIHVWKRHRYLCSYVVSSEGISEGTDENILMYDEAIRLMTSSSDIYSTDYLKIAASLMHDVHPLRPFGYSTQYIFPDWIQVVFVRSGNSEQDERSSKQKK